MTPRLVTQAELARELGVKRQAINDLVKRNVLPTTNGKIDIELARSVLQDRLDPARSKILVGMADAPGPTTAAVDPPDEGFAGNGFHVAKTLREAANARMDQLRLAQMEGSLVEAAAVTAVFYRQARMLRDMLLNIPKRLAAEIVVCGDARIAERMMTTELRHALDDFNKSCAEGAANAGVTLTPEPAQSDAPKGAQ